MQKTWPVGTRKIADVHAEIMRLYMEELDMLAEFASPLDKKVAMNSC